MDKARRQELKNLKYKKRLRRIGALNADTLKSPKGPNYNYTSFKNHSAPCSCMFCSGKKYNRKALPDFAKEHNDEIYHTAQYFGEFATHYGACLIR